MTDNDVFERRLRASLIRHVAGAPTDFDALGFARMVAAKEPRQRPFGTAITWSRPAPLRPAWLLLLACLLVALAGGALIGAQLLRDRLEGPVRPPSVRWATAPNRWVVDPVPPIAVTAVAAVSADEAWATDGDALWHFVDGAWAGPFAAGLPVLTALEAASGAGVIDAIAVAPDGVVWGIGASGLARFGGVTWELVLPRGSHAVDSGSGVTPTISAFFGSLAVGADGTVWAGTGGGSVYGLDPASGEVTRHFCGDGNEPLVAADGSLYLWEYSGLWVLQGGTCTRLDPPWEGTRVDVYGVVADPAGGLLMTLRELSGPPWNAQLVRFDGGRWTTLAALPTLDPVPPDDRKPVGEIAAVDPAGGVFFTKYVWVRRFDGDSFVDVVADGSRFDVEALSMAPDGTAWIVGSRGVERLRPVWDEASPAPTPAGWAPRR